MKPGCNEEISVLEGLLERKLTKWEKDLYEYAYDRGYAKAVEHCEDEEEFSARFKMDAEGNLTRI